MASLHELVTAEDRQALADLGFMALGQARPDLAVPLFEGLVALSPPGGTAIEAAAIGLGMAHVGIGEPEKAVGILRDAPPSESVTLYLAIALAGSGKIAEAREMLEDLLALGADPAHATLARETLEGLPT
ncbi:MAG: hypothetical protein AAFP23_04080 [Pseudomonadota bacterium]